MGQEDFKRKLTAILSADVVSYSRLMGDDESATVKTLEIYKGVMSSLIKQHRGRVVDSPGDNLLAEFGSVVDAVQCAVSIQKELQTRNVELSENRKMEFRIGINLGDVIEEQDRIYGDGVNIAARLEALADPGGICISKTAFDYIENKLPFGYRFIGEQTVKNIARPIGAYKVLMEPRLIDEEKQKTKTSFWRKKFVLSFGIIVILAIGVVLYWNFLPREASIEPVTIKPEHVIVTPEIKQAPKTIAVLPFEDISPDKDQEYFVDGLSEEVINYLSKISGLHITSRTSSFAFKGTKKSIKEIATLLEREYILEGSVRKSGNALRITAQLIRAADDYHLWSETYDRELKDIFEIQEDIARSVADKLKLTLEALKLLGGTENIEAYELYLNAKGKRAESSVSGFKSALELLDAAILLDPEFALAWAFKAQNYILLSYYGDSSGTDMEYALNAAQKAIELEPNLVDGYICLGTVKGNKDLIAAEQSIRKALELMGESFPEDAHFIVPHYLAVGNFEKALEIMGRLRRNDPVNPFLAWYYSAYVFLGDRQQSEEKYQSRNRLMTKGYSDWHDDSITMARLGSGDLLTANDIVSLEPIHLTGKKYLDSPKDGLIELRNIYNRDEYLSVMEMGRITLWAAYFGDHDFAMEVLEKTRDIFHIWYPRMRDDRKSSRFKKLVREMGLVDYWKTYGWPDLCHPVGDDDFECE